MPWSKLRRGKPFLLFGDGRQTACVRLLTLLVVVGGLMRLYGIATVGNPGGAMLFGLAMELVVTPALCLWQGRVARRAPI